MSGHVARAAGGIRRFGSRMAAVTVSLLLAAVFVAPMAGAQEGGCPEPNDDFTSACPIAAGATVQSMIERLGDVDMCRFVVGGSGGQVSLDLTDLPADYDLYLADAGGGVLGQSVHEGQTSEQLIITVLPGTYFAVVQADPAREVDPSRPYSLRLTSNVGSTAPSASAPAVQMSERRVLAADTFDDPVAGFLPRGSPAPQLTALAYVDGEYSVKNVGPAQDWQGVQIPGNYADATLTFDYRIVGEDTGRVVNVRCRSGVPPSPDRVVDYQFRVYPSTREFEIVRSDILRRPVTLVARQTSAAIRRGNEWNRLEMSCIGDTITVRANGEELASVRDTAFRTGWFQIQVGGPVNAVPPVEGRLDNLVVYGP